MMLLLIVNDTDDNRADQQQNDHRELGALIEAPEAIERGINNRVEIAIVGQSVTSSIHDCAAA